MGTYLVLNLVVEDLAELISYEFFLLAHLLDVIEVFLDLLKVVLHVVLLDHVLLLEVLLESFECLLQHGHLLGMVVLKNSLVQHRHFVFTVIEVL